MKTVTTAMGVYTFDEINQMQKDQCVYLIAEKTDKKDTYLVLYVGSTTDLHNRFCTHYSHTYGNRATHTNEIMYHYLATKKPSDIVCIIHQYVDDMAKAPAIENAAMDMYETYGFFNKYRAGGHTCGHYAHAHQVNC